MTTTTTTPLAPIGAQLTDRDCVILDGKCNCKFNPGATWSLDCKYAVGYMPTEIKEKLDNVHG